MRKSDLNKTQFYQRPFFVDSFTKAGWENTGLRYEAFDADIWFVMSNDYYNFLPVIIDSARK